MSNPIHTAKMLMRMMPKYEARKYGYQVKYIMDDGGLDVNTLVTVHIYDKAIPDNCVDTFTIWLHRADDKIAIYRALGRHKYHATSVLETPHAKHLRFFKYVTSYLRLHGVNAELK